MNYFFTKYKSVGLIVLLFIISVLIRIPTLNKPLSFHSEWITGHILTTLQIWVDNGIDIYNYNLVYTYNNPNDKFLEALAQIPDKNSNYYYVSYPPFAFYLPYFVFKILNIYPDVLAIKIFNLFFHFIASLFIYLIICRIYEINGVPNLYLPALISATFYIFLPACLWYHSNFYFTDILGQVLFIICTYLCIPVLENKNFSTKQLYIVYIFLFLLCYTEWIGYFFALTLTILFIIQKYKIKHIIFLVCIPFLTLLILIAQYQTICGFDCLYNQLKDKFLYRSGMSDSQHGLFSWNMYLIIFKHYIYEFSKTFWTVLACSGIYVVYLLKENRHLKINKNKCYIILLTILPVIMHHFLLFQFTAENGFSVLKSSLFLLVLLGIIVNKIQTNVESKKIIFVATLCCSLFVYHFWKVNVHDVKNHSDMRFHLLGHEIGSKAKIDEMIFITGTYKSVWMGVQLNYYAKRNIAYCVDKNECIDKMKMFNKNKAIIFSITDNLIIENTEQVKL